MAKDDKYINPHLLASIDELWKVFFDINLSEIDGKCVEAAIIGAARLFDHNAYKINLLNIQYDIDIYSKMTEAALNRTTFFDEKDFFKVMKRPENQNKVFIADIEENDYQFLDHTFLIYNHSKLGIILIDPDRRIIKEIKTRDDFRIEIPNWKECITGIKDNRIILDYFNGDKQMTCYTVDKDIVHIISKDNKCQGFEIKQSTIVDNSNDSISPSGSLIINGVGNNYEAVKVDFSNQNIIE